MSTLCKIAPIMPAFCSLLLSTHYGKKIAGEINCVIKHSMWTNVFDLIIFSVLIGSGCTSYSI